MNKLKLYYKKFIDGFDDVLDMILPFSRIYKKKGPEEFIKCARKIRSVLSILMLLINLFYLSFLVYMLLFVWASFFVDKDNLIFLPSLISFLLMLYGLYHIFSHRIRGIFILFAGITVSSGLFYVFESFVTGAYQALIPTFLLLCIIRCLDFHTNVAISVLKTRLKNELEEQQYASLMKYYNSSFQLAHKRKKPSDK